MKSFLEYIKENIEDGTPTADMRMDRPGNYSLERELNLLSQLQKPENRQAVAKVLKDHPEMAEKLQAMLKQALMQSSNPPIDFYRMSKDTYDRLDQHVDRHAGNIVKGLR